MTFRGVTPASTKLSTEPRAVATGSSTQSALIAVLLDLEGLDPLVPLVVPQLSVVLMEYPGVNAPD